MSIAFGYGRHGPKIEVYFTPIPVVLALAAAALLGWLATGLAGGMWRWPAAAGAIAFTALTILAVCALVRARSLERSLDWDRPERLLILAPHQDDCVICAGGLGIRNIKLGGETHIVYLVQDDQPGMAPLRRAEVEAAWSLAGLPADRLHHLDLLPPVYVCDPARSRSAGDAIGRILDEIKPTVVIMPMFEGGHVHHDTTNRLTSAALAKIPAVRLYEAPAYSPFVSLRWTPHKIVALCGRWLFGLISYYGPPDGVDGRPIHTLRMTADEIALKRRMLAAFATQNAASLASACAYPDRLVDARRGPFPARPFALRGSYLSCALALERYLPAGLVALLLPGRRGTVGREPAITDLHDELGAACFGDRR